jgi:hypothetical protein
MKKVKGKNSGCGSQRHQSLPFHPSLDAPEGLNAMKSGFVKNS